MSGQGNPTLAELVEDLDEAERRYRVASGRERDLYDQWLRARAMTEEAGAAVDRARDRYHAGRVNAAR